MQSTVSREFPEQHPQRQSHPQDSALPVVAILHADSLHYSQTLVFPRYFLFVYINNNTRVIISLRKTNVFYHKSRLLLVDLPHNNI